MVFAVSLLMYTCNVVLTDKAFYNVLDDAYGFAKQHDMVPQGHRGTITLRETKKNKKLFRGTSKVNVISESIVKDMRGPARMPKPSEM